MNEALKISAEDNVAVVLQDIEPYQSLQLRGSKDTISSREKISAGHKIALRDIEEGGKIIKYGSPIGVATDNIRTGEWVHTHNVKTRLEGKLSLNYEPETVENGSCNFQSTFKGYRRNNGRAGIRNEIWILPTVGCINKVIERITKTAEKKLKKPLEISGIDGIEFFSHPYGCSQLGKDLENTQKLLASLIKHPNAAGVLICGLGCENNTIADFKKIIGEYNEERVKFLIFQEVENEYSTALEKIEQLVEYGAKFSREKISVSNLKLGLKCGGSDSFSGITANPLLGNVSDRLIDCGGASILSEVPEMFGAEEVLARRASSKEVFEKFMNVINNFKDYFMEHGQEIYENPSPGNIEGGITTLEEKSLGNVEKGGSREVVDVRRYGEQIDDQSGLHLLESPGNDLVSTTALAAAGAHVVLFTTGRGTPFGGPVPTLKISTNNKLYEKKRNWIDFNAGRLLVEDPENVAKNLYEYLLKICSGKKKTINEKNDFKEIALFKSGVTL